MLLFVWYIVWLLLTIIWCFIFNPCAFADDLGGGASEEEVHVERVEHCLSLDFRCSCEKGYDVLLSENDCY